MQLDFHHAVTYVLARLAGFPHGKAVIVAHASQYVDDAINQGTLTFDDGSIYEHIASAHTTWDIAHHLRNREDWRVWVPFHFLPGNNGAPAGADPGEATPAQRLQCLPDSPMAERMWEACIQTRGQANALQRLGITAHTYADTFAHQRFCGIRSDWNQVGQIRLGRSSPELDLLLAEAMAVDASHLDLGHGGVATFPDLPFLPWSYVDSNGKEVPRDNLAIHLTACRRLHANFSYYLGKGDQPLAPKDLEALTMALSDADDTEETHREKAWLGLLEGDTFSFGSLAEGELQDLDYKAKGPGSWKHLALGTEDVEEPEGRTYARAPFEGSLWKGFHDALKDHRALVLDTLLPAFGLADLDAFRG